MARRVTLPDKGCCMNITVETGMGIATFVLVLLIFLKVFGVI